MIFEFLFVFAGILTIFRNIYVIFNLFELNFMSSYIKNYYLYGIVLSIFLIFLIFQLDFPFNYFVFGVLFLLSFLLKPIAEVYLDQKMRVYFGHALNVLVLKMKTGHSFLNALKSISKESDPILCKKMSNISSLLEYWNEEQVKTLKGFDLEIVLRLQEIKQSSSHRLKQIIHFRDEINMRNEFLSKARQAAFQTRLQSGLLIGIYLITAFLMIKTYQFEMMKFWLLLSLPLLILGTYLIINIPKRFKWNI